MEGNVKVGDFWFNINDKNTLVEVRKIVDIGIKRVDSIVRFWRRTGTGKYYMVTKDPVNLTVFHNEFDSWKKLEFDIN